MTVDGGSLCKSCENGINENKTENLKLTSLQFLKPVIQNEVIHYEK